MAMAPPSHYSHHALVSLRRRPSCQPTLSTVPAPRRPHVAAAPRSPFAVFAALAPHSPYAYAMFGRLRASQPAMATSSGGAITRRPKPLSVVDALVEERVSVRSRVCITSPQPAPHSASWSEVSLNRSAAPSASASAAPSPSIASALSPLPFFPLSPPAPGPTRGRRDSAFVGFFTSFADDGVSQRWSNLSVVSPGQPPRPPRSPARPAPPTPPPPNSKPTTHLRPLLLARCARPARRRTRPRTQTPDSPTLITAAARGGLVPIGSVRHHRLRADASWLTQAQDVLADIHVADEAESPILLSAGVSEGQQ